MKISRTTLQSFFTEELPNDDKVVEIFTFGAFEVEGAEKYDKEFGGKKVSDTVFDLKILPDRACYALSWQGIAYEFAALSGMRMKSSPFASVAEPKVKLEDVVSVKVEPNADCNRQLAVYVDGLEAKSPAWLALELDKVGQRSISAIVDITNYAMFMVGEPLHAFDSAKVKGDIVIRKAAKGENITLLDGSVKTLDETMTVIADDEGALDIAGVKGGKRAEVTGSTSKIILVASSFDPVSIRRTSTKVGIKNDAAKRFENGLSWSWSRVGLLSGLDLIGQIFPKAKFSKVTDVIVNEEPKSPTLTVNLPAINSALGTKLNIKEVNACLEALLFEVHVHGEILTVSAPIWRKDINIVEDLYEEIGRVYGYDKIPSTLPPRTEVRAINPTFYVTEWLKNLLVERGFNEVILHTLSGEGHYETAYPVASDKAFLRSNLTKNMKVCLEENARRSDYLGILDLLIFEIGRVFDGKDGKGENGTPEGEHIHLSIAVSLDKSLAKKKKTTPSQLIINTLEEMSKVIGCELQGQVSSRDNQAWAEVPLDLIIAKLSASGKLPVDYSVLNFGKTPDTKYKLISPYPYSVRDVAFFVTGNMDQNEQDKTNQANLELIRQNAGDILVSVRLFDVFTKTFESKSEPTPGTIVTSKLDKTSYAYRLILQSDSKTLTEEEINGSMEKVYNALKSAGFEIR